MEGLAERAGVAEQGDEVDFGRGTADARIIEPERAITCFAVAGRAVQIATFGATHRYCGSCGAPCGAGFACSAGKCQVSGASLGNQLIAYWPFDGSSQDVSSNGLNLTLVGSPNFIPGKGNLAVIKDGPLTPPG